MTGNQSDLIIHDGRQSPIAAGVQRGVARMLHHCGFVSLPEFTLTTGRRADLIAINEKGVIWIIEIKSSLADFQADHKWHEYREFCDQFSFAHPMDLDGGIFPTDTGLIVADAFGAEITRSSPMHKLTAARRKAVTLRFAQTGAQRLQRHYDPGL